MESLMRRLAAQVSPKAWPNGFHCSPWVCTAPSNHLLGTQWHGRTFATSVPCQVQPRDNPPKIANIENGSHSQPAANLSHNVTQAEKDHFHHIEEKSKEGQMRSPWMREGSDLPPVARQRSASAMTKGKLLTTPSRMLKLILPLTPRDRNRDRKDVEPLALLVHPQQPLSYLERLIQSELPPLEENNRERAPTITFRAQDSMEEEIGSQKSAVESAMVDEGARQEDYDIQNPDETMVEGKVERTGELKNTSPSEITTTEDGALPANSHGRNDPDVAGKLDKLHPHFVRWSPSTEIGDFIRDAARGKEFAVDIEGASAPIYVGVPSFKDRTYYLRIRLRKTARRISEMAVMKRECDKIARRGAKTVAQCGFAGLIGWWGAVYYLTFKTDLGWDVMEPVTYLVGLTSLIGGYMWFLYHDRDVSYRSAMNFTVSRRQSQLYEQKGFNLQKWETLIEEGNRLRREIKMVADEYDVDWDESKDEGDEKVKEALRKARKKNGKEKRKKEEDDDEGED